MQIIYSSPYVPAEWIAAHGFEPRRILPTTVTPRCAIARMEGLCPYVRAFMNSILTHPRACGAVITTVCDQMRRGFELVDGTAKIPCFLMNVPKTWQNAPARDLYIDEISRLGRFLVQLGGKSPSRDGLSTVMLKYDTARKTLLDLKTRLSSKQFSQAIALFASNGPDGLRKAIKPSDKIGDGVPLAVIGGPLMKEDFSLFDIIENFGGRVVLDGTETGERGMCPSFDEEKIQTDPLGELGNAYFIGIPDASRRPNTLFYDWLQRELKSRAVEGIILWRYIWCDLWHAELQRIRQLSNLPVLEIEVDGEEKELSQRTKQRICSFMEVILCAAGQGK